MAVVPIFLPAGDGRIIRPLWKLLEKLGAAGMPDVVVVAAEVMCSARVFLRGDDILMDTLPDICVFPMLSDTL